MDNKDTMTKGGMPLWPGLYSIPSSPSEKPKLLATRCKSCGKIFFPPRVGCLSCFKEEMEEVPLSQRGKIYAFTIVRRGELPGFKTPYALAFIDLPEGVRVFSQITEGIESLKIGQEVELCIAKIREDESGSEVMGYKFRPI